MGMLFLFFNWSITSDMVLYTVVPTRRATACAMQIMVSHLFGDATSPLIIGAVRTHTTARGAYLRRCPMRYVAMTNRTQHDFMQYRMLCTSQSFFKYWAAPATS
jgi:hypothetical protein